MHELGLLRKPDSFHLERAAEQGRILLTHDENTMIGFARARVKRGERMPGVFVVHQSSPIGRIITDLHLLIECSKEGEWENQIIFLPL